MKRMAGGFLSLLRSGDVRALFANYSDLMLAAVVALIVGTMIVPLPTLLLDLLITINIAAALTLLLITIYVSDSLKIATFPSLLLLTTLFRLAIEVSATRLILLKANAGQVIHAFGSFVVAGNLVVGIVVFLILTTIQFIVIAKGSARVAEVGARFALDAMPGKQMAIDAELRAGHIDAQEAHKRRILLARESQFFGSMDGAMKFVQGDAIAGIVVLLTNIVGGLLIGLLSRGMELSVAIRTYTLLTIGEGLVAQIPALVISTAAGILVMRVSSDEAGGHLGQDIGRQVLAHPKALAVAAALLALLAVVPGLPALPFLVLSAGLGFLAYRLLASTPKAAAAAPPPMLVPLAVDLAPGLYEVVADSPVATAAWESTLRERLFFDTGITLPALSLRHSASDLGPGGYAICLHEIPVAAGQIPPGKDPGEVLSAHLARTLRQHAHLFVGIQETQTLLAGLETTHPHLVREVVPKLLGVSVLADVLQRLAREGISLRNLPEILEALAKRPEPVGDAATLAEWVRAALRRHLTFKYGGANKTVGVFYLDAMIEETLRESLRPGGCLALEPQLSRDLLQAITHAVAEVAEPVILTSREIRRPLRELVEPSQPNVAVLAHQELLPEAKLESLGQISIRAASAG